MSTEAGASRLGRVLAEAGVDAAVLSTMPSVTEATGFFPRWEAWPGHNPHVLDPTLATLGADGDATLLLPSYFFPYGEGVRSAVATVRSASPTRPVDQAAELADAIAERLGGTLQRLGFEPRTLPVAVRDAVHRRMDVREWVDVEAALERARAVKTQAEIEGIGRAARIADLVQRTVADEARAGVSEVDLASRCLALAWADRGTRFPVLLQVKAGPDSARRGEWHPGGRAMEDGDVVLCDVAPWLDGFWADSANAVVVGEPRPGDRAVFDALSEALSTGIDALRPGVAAADVDRRVRDVLRRRGHEYPHHTGHGVGLSRFEPPRITSVSEDVVEAGNVVALEPAAYLEDRGGFRHEHLVVVREAGTELLTRFEHTL